MQKEYLVRINNTENSKKENAQLQEIYKAKTNTVEITKEIDYNNFKVISVSTKDENDKDILNEFASNGKDVIIEENQIYTIQSMNNNINHGLVRSFLNHIGKLRSFFFPPKLSIYSLNNINYPEYNLPILESKSFENPHSEQWGIIQSRCKDAWEKGYTGKGVNVGVLDTGLQIEHKSFIGRVLRKINTVGRGLVSEDVTDVCRHGTHVGGIVASYYKNIYGVAPECNLIPIKVLGDDGSGRMDDIIEGVNYAIKLGVDVINMSLGGGGYSVIFEEALKEAYDHGIIILAASGNESTGVSYPAKYKYCIPVGSYNKENKISYFSNFGEELLGGLVAPGEEILSCGTNNDYRYDTGTSMATPAVAGMAAILKQIDKQKVTPMVVKNSLINGSVKILGVGDVYQGSGKLDVPNTIYYCLNNLDNEHSVKSLSTEINFGIGCRGFIIKNIQSRLSSLNLYTSPVDGIFGKNTALAVEKFTNGKNSLNETDYIRLMGTEFPSIFDRCLQVTSTFEGTGFTKLLDDFDGACMTWGIIGFTLIHGEIPEILSEIYDLDQSILRIIFKGDFSLIRSLIIDFKGTKKVNKFKLYFQGIQSSKTNFDKYINYFKQLGELKEVQEIQLKRAKDVYWERALNLVSKFKFSEELSYALCFDCAVQGFNQSGIQKALAITEKGINNALKDSVDYQVENERRKIIAISNSETCNPKWKKDVWMRKSTFILGQGIVHGSDYNLKNWGL